MIQTHKRFGHKMFNILPSTGQKNNTVTAQPQTYKWFSLPSSLIEGITPRICRLFCPNKQRSFELLCVGEWGWGIEGKQAGSMDEESQVRGCYNITFICTPTNQETVSVLEKTQANKTFRT